MRHCLQAGRLNRLKTMLTHHSGVGQPLLFASTLVKIGGEVQSLHGSGLYVVGA
jgi:hypothetical protein